ncbi:iron-sulfur cluster repair di-iron protein [Pseudogracilibacillus auburnensis]|uniref:iron-sulfur cluster repair di-iron protein n=1 Tax=Pseudogracilibacillus auburnensis TaxID=1494959 RepID=UPI001A95DF95|nr:iron-sulfur cluster repair di-iron protein [Pseudogracilibacillus auburnensis]MBO1002465.1 iron-sulfur cluster repair di-iron protein [Pseudogracilibacillus auburnensis]
MKLFTAENTPAYIVKVFPQASDIFIKYMIDYCCGGSKPLKESFKEKNLPRELILSELNTAYQNWRTEDNEVMDWDTVPLPELIDHIVHHHHDYLKNELPALGEFVTKIFRVHGADEPHLQDLHRLYNEFRTEMEQHTIKEEAEVFPLIKQYAENPNPELLQRIKEANGDLEDEHEVAGDLLKKMRSITNGFVPPIHACGSYHITYDRLAELELDTFQHVHLENNVLFAQL